MNKRSVKRRPTKAGHSSAARKAVSRRTSSSRKSAPRSSKAAANSRKVTAKKAVPIASVTLVPQIGIGIRAPGLRMHKYRVGQAVLYTSSPISRPGANGSYQVVKLLPSDGDDYQYRIKNSGEAFERVAKESQLELEH